MMITLRIDARYDAHFVIKKAGVKDSMGSPWPAPDDEEKTILSIDDSELEAVHDVLNNYDYLMLVEARERALARLAALRWAATQSFVFDGVRTQADPAIAAVTGAAYLGQFLPEGTVRKWKLSDGVFRQWTVPQIIEFGAAIANHIQECFDREEELSELILNAGTYEVVEEIDLEAGWPA